MTQWVPLNLSNSFDAGAVICTSVKSSKLFGGITCVAASHCYKAPLYCNICAFVGASDGSTSCKFFSSRFAISFYRFKTSPSRLMISPSTAFSLLSCVTCWLLSVLIEVVCWFMIVPYVGSGSALANSSQDPSFHTYPKLSDGASGIPPASAFKMNLSCALSYATTFWSSAIVGVGKLVSWRFRRDSGYWWDSSVSSLSFIWVIGVSYEIDWLLHTRLEKDKTSSATGNIRGFTSVWSFMDSSWEADCFSVFHCSSLRTYPYPSIGASGKPLLSSRKPKTSKTPS